MREALFEGHRAWAEGIARSVHRTLPPSFDIADLQQEAVIEHWKRVESYDPALNDNYRAYAYPWVLNAVRMATRRKAYREATHEELNGYPYVDPAPQPDAVLLAREERRNVTGPRDRRRLAKVRAALAELPPADAYLLRRYMAGADADAMARLWGGNPKTWEKRLMRAVARLKRARLA